MERYENILGKHLAAIIDRYPEKPAYIIKGVATSYSEMHTMARHIASGIIAARGTGNEEQRGTTTASSCAVPYRIGISLPKNSHYVSCIMAVMLLHCSYVPIDIFTPVERKQSIIEDADIKFIIDESNIDALLTHPILNVLPDLSSPEFSEAYIIYTSGTTGKPKGVSISYEALCSFVTIISQPDRLNISCNSRVLQFASINFDASVLEIFPALYNGATLIIATEEERLDTHLLYELMVNEHVTYTLLPPSLLAVFPSYNFPDMDTLSIGGEAAPRKITEQIVGKYSYRFVNAYGPTENTVVTTTHVFRNADDYRCIGTTLPGIKRMVVDNEGNMVKRGNVGELIVGGKQLTNCYWKRRENNAASFTTIHDVQTGESWRGYHTGDLVSENEDGTFMYHGRIDSQVKLHGFRIELQEIITRIESHPRVLRAACYTENLGNDKYLTAYVQTIDGNENLDDVKQYAKEFMPPYMMPTFWNHVNSFSLTLNGKIDRSTLCNNAWRNTCNNSRTPRNNEQILINVVKSLLGTEDVNMDADLIEDIGLTSLQIMQIPPMIEDTGLKVTVDDIYTHRTISKIVSNHLYRLSFWYSDPSLHPERKVLVFFCGHPYFGYFSDFLPSLADRYNIFVIESYHSILHFEVWTTPELVKLYEMLVTPIHAEYDVAGYIGYCMGGEHALFVAYNLFTDPSADSSIRQNIRLPHVVVLDGEVLRDKDPSHFIPMRWPALTEKQNDIRQEMDTTLIATYPDDHIYHGSVTSFLSNKFADQWTVTPEEMNNISSEAMEAVHHHFTINPQKWAKAYPQATIKMVDADHFSFMHDPATINLVAEYIKKEI